KGPQERPPEGASRGAPRGAPRRRGGALGPPSRDEVRTVGRGDPEPDSIRGRRAPAGMGRTGPQGPPSTGDFRRLSFTPEADGGKTSRGVLPREEGTLTSEPSRLCHEGDRLSTSPEVPPDELTGSLPKLKRRPAPRTGSALPEKPSARKRTR